MDESAGRTLSAQERTTFAVLVGLSVSHCLNDVVQSTVPALYPLLKSDFALDFGQIGLIQAAFQITASLFQPVVGMVTDKRPRPYSLPIGMAATLCGLLLLAVAPSYGLVLLAAAGIGLGSSIFHPEASRVARLASGGRHGFAQSLFQVGGNAGSALGPLLVALLVVPFGRLGVLWFTAATLAAMLILSFVGRWYAAHLHARRAAPRRQAQPTVTLPQWRVVSTITILMTLVFSKFFYFASLTSFFTFYLIHTFGVSIQQSQLYLFVFLGSLAVGTLIGGPIGDRFGRKRVIWASVLGALPFSLLLPHANLFWTVALTIPIGLIMSSAFPAILVYAQELLPGRVGMVSGLFFGLAFGMGGIGAAVLGEIADHTSIDFIYRVCAFLPAIGILAAFLPDLRRPQLQAA